MGISTVILARGYGTRMRPLTESVPKPMLPIGRYPFLAYLVSHYLCSGVNEVIITAGWLGNVIQNYFDHDPWCQFPIKVTHGEPLGTGSTLVETASLAQNSEILMVGGDLIVDFEVAELAIKHRTSQLHCTFVVSEQSPQNQGAFHVDADDKLLYSEEAFGPRNAGKEIPQVVSYTSSTGAALLERDYLTKIKSRPDLSIEKDLIPDLIGKRQIQVFDIGQKFFWEFGVPERYEYISQHSKIVEEIYGDPIERLSRI